VFGKKKKKEKVVGEDEKEEIKFDEKEDEKYLDLNGAVDSSIPPSPSSLIRVEKKKREKGGVAVKRTFSQMTEFTSTKEGTNSSTIAIETTNTNTNKRRDDEDDHVLPILSRSEKKQRKKQAMERLLGGS
jgi:hypothetical protein